MKQKKSSLIELYFFRDRQKLYLEEQVDWKRKKSNWIDLVFSRWILYTYRRRGRMKEKISTWIVFIFRDGYEIFAEEKVESNK